MEIWNHDLIDICLDFYKEDDVLAVRTIVDNHGDRLQDGRAATKSINFGPPWKILFKLCLIVNVYCQCSMPRMCPEFLQ